MLLVIMPDQSRPLDHTSFHVLVVRRRGDPRLRVDFGLP